MELDELLTTEERKIVQEARSRYAEWLIGFVRQNKQDKTILTEELELITATRKEWWIKRQWEWFAELLSIDIELLHSDTVLRQDLIKLVRLEKNKDSELSALTYTEIAKDQYYDGNESFYIEMGLDRFEESWKLFEEALLRDPYNLEIYYHFIGLMFQSNSVTRGRLFRAIRDFLKVPREKAKSGSNKIEKIYEEILYVARKLKPREIESSELEELRDIIMLASQSSEISRSMKQRLLEPFDDPEAIDAEKFVAQELREIEMEKAV